MEKVLHRSEKRGRGDYGWLTTRYSFSFANWFDPARMGFGALRVINDDAIAPHTGFGAHSHENMEIVTIVLEGQLTHRDSMGNVGIVGAGEVQVMSAGTGVTHAEHNEGDIPLKLFQVWLLPRTPGGAPRYEQQAFPNVPGAQLLVAPVGVADALGVQQDAYITRVTLHKEETYSYTPYVQGSGVYVLVITGELSVQDVVVGERDAFGLTSASSLALTATHDVVALVFEVPMTS